RPKRNRSRHSNTLSNTSGPLLASPYQGSVLRVVRQPGDTVTVGQTVLVIEAMKMENEIAAHCDGTLVSVLPQPGTSVRIGDPLFVIE
ncbi:MAG TPA: acetyl-CoA carboxylase biotin carboxyl carrier protein subunit, partial [Thermomicrobiales bacterium]|nr:acetyl-CoA carboxylase biotin carboxyl carrier protein subunit [Thermomicrobiales bacterium]